MRAYDEELVFVYNEDYKTFHEEGEQELFAYRVTLGVLMCVGLMMLVVFTVIIRKGSLRQIISKFQTRKWNLKKNRYEIKPILTLIKGIRTETDSWEQESKSYAQSYWAPDIKFFWICSTRCTTGWYFHQWRRQIELTWTSGYVSRASFAITIKLRMSFIIHCK